MTSFVPESPKISPKKISNTLASQDITSNEDTIKENSTFSLSPNRPNSVHDKVALLSIHGSDGAHKNLLESLESKIKAPPKRRRSSAQLALQINNNSSHNESLSRKNSVTSMKVIKKKKKMNKPMELKVFETAYTKKISIKDLRDLTLFLMNANNNMPQWLRLKNRPQVLKMVVLFMPGLEPQDFEIPSGKSFSTDLPYDNHIFLKNNTNETLIQNCTSVPITAPGSRLSLFSSYNSFINVGLTKNEKQLKKNELSNKKVVIDDLIMRLDQLMENGYPIHPHTEGITDEDRVKDIEINNAKENDPLWYNTISFDHAGSHIFGLDCEMCLAGKDFVLTRVSILDFQNNVIYDELVKPDVEITDYLTRYSGITKEKLDPVTTTLKDVQHKIIKLISSKDILIGHSLQSDLLALKLRHPRIVDTAVIYDHKAGPPFKPALKYLASEYLNISIQNNNDDGHDSIEDARTCIELTKSKILNGLWFGISINTENLFVRLSERSNKKSLILNDYVSKNFDLKDNICVGNSQALSLSKKIRCISDTEVYDNIQAHLDDFDICVGRLRELEFNRGYSQRPPRSASVNPKTSDEILKLFNERINKIYEELPVGSVIFLVNGCGDTKDFNHIMQEMNALNKEDRIAMKQERGEELASAVLKARDSVASVIVKTESTTLN
ncbi:similar to Saccharomyces cerevisiae YGR276C RNH70 3'-5' exoribonuclease [Maudiozyma barnettii]|uniref:Similar to Saccharomyces cerevisiae YGR276C RNH70 3'-5' exoribonuclease n=1 Tax=Maudiozyma barnettii TaxID=61262 RepID=A0A8H2ZLH8_9SACH|nr:similar to Saccharomyces cerevisiae YGR276C RNH70 3'-5' exoribonuclease [Kazachstania barnettii]CAB4256147.1 similar to Saccharomyces cerevisiae YGR276C RNH70 3'-5' exoribonuclease [Kazachstania barnettii]CAD1784755.1 similar to Saccharomyces cerevisiae YGR276C RNH70 3'-5' exoribonuclease [Kazachstania barnettii]